MALVPFNGGIAIPQAANTDAPQIDWDTPFRVSPNPTPNPLIQLCELIHEAEQHVPALAVNAMWQELTDPLWTRMFNEAGGEDGYIEWLEGGAE